MYTTLAQRRGQNGILVNMRVLWKKGIFLSLLSPYEHMYICIYQGFHSNHAQTARFNIPTSYIAAITMSSEFMCGPCNSP